MQKEVNVAPKSTHGDCIKNAKNVIVLDETKKSI